MSAEILKSIDRLLKPAGPPDRIYGWIHTQMSIARHYGAIDYQGERYVIDENTEGQPLVRLSVLAAEGVAKRLAAKQAKKALIESMNEKQGGLV